MSLSVDTSKFNSLISRFSAELGIGVREVIRTQARLFLQTAIRLTPPKTLAQGRAAVERDIKRAVSPLREEDFQSESIKKIIRDKDKAAMEDVLPRIRPGWQLVDFSPALHQDVRKTGGRVTKQWKRATLDVRAWQKYVTSIQKRAGRLKAAWLPALRAVGGEAPNWVTRHDNPSGYYENGLDSALFPSFTAANHAPGVGSYRRIFAAALKARVSAMTSDIRRRLREAAQKAKLS